MVKLDESKLTSQGQVSIPKKIRETLKLEKGCKVAFFVDKKGRVYIEQAESPVEFTKEDWELFFRKTQAEKVTEYDSKKAAMDHIDRILRKRPA